MDDLIKALQLPSPLQSFCFDEFPDKQILIKRDDLIHPLVSGNKWRKLKYNVKHALDNDCVGILSFGGAFSNHLYALSAACKLAGIKCKAHIRGDGFDKDNPTLQFLISQEADLTFIDRSTYRQKAETSFLLDLQQQFPKFHIVPEGGSNDLAISGVTELMNEAYDQIQADRLLVVCGVGSGSTITGIVKGLRAKDKALGILAVNDKSLVGKISSLLTDSENQKLTLDLDSHFGGFGKTNDSLISFINDFYFKTKIPLDPLYNGKVLYRLIDLMRKGELEEYDKILVVHTGGLQGNKGYDYRFPNSLNGEMVSRC